MQLLELVTFYALVGIAIYLFRGKLATLDEAPVWWRLAAGFAVGALIAFPMVVRGVDILSDRWEPMALTGLVTVVVVTLMVVLLRRERPG